MIRSAKILLLSLLALLIPTLLFCGWLLSTTSGLSWLLNRFDQLVQVETVEGSLAGEFTLGGLAFASATANLSLDTLAIKWHPSGLLAGNLVIDQISLSGLNGRSVPNDQASEISGLRSPIDISITQATAERISWNDQQIEKVSFAGLLRGQTLQITQLDVAAPRLQMQASGKVNVGLRGRGIVELEQQLTYQLPDAAPLSVKSRLSGQWSSLEVAVDIAAPYQTVVTGTVDKVLRDSRKADLLISLANADLPMATQTTGVSGVSGDIKLNSVGTAIDTDLDLTLLYTRAARRTNLRVLGSASVDEENLTIRQLRLSEAGKSAVALPATVAGQTGSPLVAVPVAGPGLRISGTVSGYRAILANRGDAANANFDLLAEWSDPTIWEVFSESAIASPRGNISISGPLSNYQLAIDIDLAQKPAPTADQSATLTGKLLGSGSGSAKHFDLTDLALSGFVGSATGRARVGWQDSLSWSTELAVSGLRTEFFVDTWPGLVNGNLLSSGTQSANGLSGSIKADNISGELRELPLRAALDLQFENSQFELTTLNAKLGSSLVTAQGRVGEQSNLGYTLVAPDLGLFADHTGGSINASGTLLGNISTPRVIGKASASQLRFKHWQLAEFNSDFDISLASGNAPWTGSLAVKDLSLDQQKIIEKSTISLSGNALAHQLEIRSSFINQMENDISVKSRWDAGTWSGRLEKLQFKDSHSNDWALSNPADFSLSGQRQIVSKFCLLNRGSATAATASPSLCAALDQTGDHQIAELDLQRIPSALFNSLLTKYGFNIDTEFDAELEAKFSWRSDYRPSLFAAIHSNRGLLKYRMTAAPTDSVVVSKKARPLDRQLEYSNFHLVVESIDNTSIIVAANLEEEGYLRGRLSVEESLFSERLTESSLTGIAIAALPSLSMLAASQRATVSIGGSLQANLDIGGLVANPALDLNIAVTDGELYMPEAGVHLTELDLKVISQADSRASIAGSAVSGSGEYLLDGLINLSDASEIDGRIMLVGSNVALVHTETMHADGDVSLTLQLQERNLDLSGEIAIARGSVGTSNSPGVISESGDVIILSDSPRSKPLTTTADITIDLGDDMQINASGLSGRLTGKPRITRSKSGLITSTGNITIVDGKFAAYGQKLDISKGQASYAGGDIDNPALLVEATRTIRDIKAGISITGSAENPEVRLFSEPAMNDQDILSYLVFAKPIDQLNSADGLRLLSIANSLRGGSSTSQLDLLSDRIASTFGLESVNLEFDISGESPSVGIRSQITSRLEVGYGYNFISSIRTILLRYKLTDNWSIQSNIDVESGADFKYQIEK